MAVNHRFDYVLARSRTRETSILAVASIAASASLVLLGLYFQAEIDAKGTSDKEALFNSYKSGMQF